MSPSEARSVRLVGAAIAALSGLLAAGSLLVHWWSRGVACGLVPCRQPTISGWSGLGPARVLLLAVAPAGVLPLVGEIGPRSVRRWLALVAGMLALSACLLIVFRVAVGPIGSVPAGVSPGGLVRGVEPQAVPSAGSSVVAGPFIAFVACAGVAGGAMLSGIGHRFFEATRAAAATAAVIWTACLGLIVSLWLPWLRPGIAVVPAASGVLRGGLATESAWHGLGTLSVLLLLGTLAVAGGAAIAVAFRWRAVFLALAVAGWLLAACAVAATPFPEGPRFVLVIQRVVGYEPGYYVCLGCAAIIVVAGMAAAFSEGRHADVAPDLT